MMERKQIAAGNWKMNTDYNEGRDLAKAVVAGLQPSDVLVVLGVPFIHLKNISGIIQDVSNIRLAAQNCHQEESGAYTGEISAAMLKSCGVDFVILGHSERREYFGEKDELIARKIDIVLRHGMQPIYCCGERLEVREAGKHEEVVGEQVKAALFHLSKEQMGQVVVAYEPVWAIGTGRTASPEQAQEMHRHIRSLLQKKFGKDVANATSILYGGSVKPDNARELFGQPDVDGGLVGGASLKAKDFLEIAGSF
ncbi:MAG: triose-phosphate isomerase [Phaeodactylibacter sp.]|nr:triose-phosphate isomerase [Phaeodactylibacter sp.]